MSACDNHNKTILISLQGLQRLWDIAKGQLYLLTKACRVSQITSIIDYHNMEIKARCQPSQRLSHITSARYNQTGFRTHDFKKDLQSCSTAANSLPLIGIKMDMGER